MGATCKSTRYPKSSSRLWQGKVFVFGLLLAQWHVTQSSAAAFLQDPTAADSGTVGKNLTSLAAVPQQMGSKAEILKEEAVLNFTLSDGDEVGCIRIERQPSLNVGDDTFPFQLRPSSKVKRGNSTKSSRGAVRACQTFNVEVGACPEGTIPVRRSRDIYNLTSIFFANGSTEANEYSRASSWTLQSNLRRKEKNGPPSRSHPSDGNGNGNSTADDDDDDEDKSPHEHAFVYARNPESNSRIKGMEVILNIWEPFVEDEEEFSLAQFWLISGSYKGNLTKTVNNFSTILNTIEAGWQVFEGLYGDNRSRLFLFWTADAYNDTGCYNLHCSGFVQTSNKVLVGGSFTPTSQVNSTQYEIELLVFRDEGSGNWWLVLNDEPVGYWPSELFSGRLRDSADYVEFGGEVIDWESADQDRHTRTHMGSGYYPEAGPKVAAYQRNLQIVDETMQLRDAEIQLGVPEAPTCYNALIRTDFRDWGSYFFYGGTGYSNTCTHDQEFQ